jgi:hypothetical protein
MELTGDQNLIWQLASDVSVFSDPIRIKDTKPEWFQNLPGNLKQLDLSNRQPSTIKQLQAHGFRSAKFCLGLKGIRSLGWTIPIQEEIDSICNEQDKKSYRQAYLHPEMLNGTKWNQLDNRNKCVWNIKIISLPWRAKMSKGFRLLIGAYPLEWSNDWFCFSGCVDSNYRVTDFRNIGSFWDFEESIDTNFNYYNVEFVIAIKEQPQVKIPSNSLVFSMIPVWDPDYEPAQFKGFPSFND